MAKNVFEEGEGAVKETISLNYLADGLEMGLDKLRRLKNIVTLSLQKRRKLCLVLDLDHTLIHTINLATLSPYQKLGMSFYEGDDIFEWNSPGKKLVTKLRPFVRDFLEEASQMFQLYVYTMGSRDYALHIVDEFLDPQGIYFGKRVIAREDCTVPEQKGLDVVPVHPSAVLVLDDTDWIWERNSDNVIVIEKYNYSLQVVEEDECEGEEELRNALEVLRKLHTLYFECYDRIKDGDVRDLVQNYWEDFINDQGHQEVGTGTCSSHMGFGKHSRLDDECSSVSKKQRIIF